jgi:hypothetical protein
VPSRFEIKIFEADSILLLYTSLAVPIGSFEVENVILSISEITNDDGVGLFFGYTNIVYGNTILVKKNIAEIVNIVFIVFAFH